MNTDAEYIAARVAADEDGCWLWTLGKDRDGYAVSSWTRGTHRAHRLSYEAHRGPIPDGMVLDHLCRVRHCVNPDHLEAVEPQVNIDRGELHLYRGIREREKTHCKCGTALQAMANKTNRRFCPTCKRRSVAQARARAQERGVVPEGAHGKPNTYQYYRCRCEPCRTAQNKYQVDVRARRKAARSA